MKTKKVTKYMGIVALAAMTLCSCEDLLDTKNYTQSNTQNFPTSMDVCRKSRCGTRPSDV